MNPSRLFILRPVATTLLMVAIMLVGIVAYRFLPLSALPEVDYPTIQVQTFYPGASPEVMTSSVTAPLERQFGADAEPEPDDLDQLGRRLGDHPAVRPRSQPRRRRAGGAGGDQRRRQPAAVRPAGAADLRQGQSGRRADPDAGAHLEDAAADRRSRTSPTPGWRRRSRSCPASAWSASAAASGRRCASGSIRARSPPTGSTSTTCAPRIGNANVNTPKGNFDGPAQRLHHQRQRPDPRRRATTRRWSSPTERRAGAAQRRRRRRRWRRRTPSSRAWVNTTPAVILNVQRQPGANVIEVVDSIKALLPQLQASAAGGDRRRRC